MPRKSYRAELLEKIDRLELKVSESRRAYLENEHNGLASDVDGESDDDFDMIITPPTPIMPLLGSDLEADDDFTPSEQREQRYRRFLDAIRALRDEIQKARVLQPVGVPLLRSPQLHLLEHYADFRPHLFRTRLRVEPRIFDRILDQISDHDIFQSRSNNPQLPVAIQLAIFLKRAGHYGNGCTPESLPEWAGVTVGSVINCTNRVMVAILDQHDEFIKIPASDSEDMEISRKWVEERSCRGWRNGVFAADGSTINLFQKPSIYGETFYDQKSSYSLNCQVNKMYHCWVITTDSMHQKLVIMPHNLLVADYGLGYPGSVHDAYTFQGTQIAQRADQVLPANHWIWADSAYPSQTWCVVPFKATRSVTLSRGQKVYNQHLSKVRTF